MKLIERAIEDATQSFNARRDELVNKLLWNVVFKGTIKTFVARYARNNPENS